MHVGANCFWIYEGHYHTPSTAATFKGLAPRYVSLLGSDHTYVDMLTLFSPGVIKRILAAGFHQRARASIRLFRTLHWLSRRPAIKNARRAFASVTGVYHEMYLTSTKS
jgi:hypothetical protein